MPAITCLSGRALAVLLPDLHATPGSTYSALARAVASLLLDGRVAPGTRLPSERELAASLHLSRATVTTAYNTLREQGLLISRSGSGSVTALPSPDAALSAAGRWRAVSQLLPRLDAPHPLDTGLPGRSTPERAASEPRTSELRTSEVRTSEVPAIDLTSATFPAPAPVNAAAARAVVELARYTDGNGYEPAGIVPLRKKVADRFTARGLPTSPEQILVTNGALHGLDLVLRLLCRPGERVLTELPTYSGLIDAIRANGARIVAVPVAPSGGWQLAAMTAALRQSRPRLAMIVPDFHNPTGFLASAEDRLAVLQAARRSGTTVVVDESFVELGFVDPVTPTAALDASVITVGSLSKPVWGGLRVGWVRASVELIQRLVIVRAAIDMGQSILSQLVAVELFDELGQIAAQRRAEIRPRRDFLVAALAAELPRWHTVLPQGGLSLWVELDEPRATPLTMRAAQYGVRIVAGSRFGVDGTMERFLRLPYALPQDLLGAAVTRIAAAWADLEGSGTGYSPLIVA